MMSNIYKNELSLRRALAEELPHYMGSLETPKVRILVKHPKVDISGGEPEGEVVGSINSFNEAQRSLVIEKEDSGEIREIALAEIELMEDV